MNQGFPPTRNKLKTLTKTTARVFQDLWKLKDTKFKVFNSNAYGGGTTIPTPPSVVSCTCCDRTSTVSPLDNGDFTSIQDAIDFAVGEIPSRTEPWVIKICPGVYTENIVGANFVSLVGIGLGRGSVVIIPADLLSPAYTGASNDSIENIYFRAEIPDGDAINFNLVEMLGNNVHTLVHNRFEFMMGQTAPAIGLSLKLLVISGSVDVNGHSEGENIVTNNQFIVSDSVGTNLLTVSGIEGIHMQDYDTGIRVADNTFIFDTRKAADGTCTYKFMSDIGSGFTINAHVTGNTFRLPPGQAGPLGSFIIWYGEMRGYREFMGNPFEVEPLATFQAAYFLVSNCTDPVGTVFFSVGNSYMVRQTAGAWNSFVVTNPVLDVIYSVGDHVQNGIVPVDPFQPRQIYSTSQSQFTAGEWYISHHIKIDNPPRGRVFMQGFPFPIAPGPNPIVFNAVEYDSNLTQEGVAFYNPATGIWTVPIDGCYHIDAIVEFDFTPGPVFDFDLQILINGVPRKEFHDDFPGGLHDQFRSIGVFTKLELVVGNQISLLTNSGGAGSIRVDPVGLHSSMSVHKLS